MSDAPDVLDLEPDDLDGHTLEELSDYLDNDRQPPDASIENSPACQMALAALQHLNDLAAGYLDDDETPIQSDEEWIGAVLTALPLELRRGRLFPIPTVEPDVDLHVTEGALRGFIRATGDAVPGILVGSVHIDLEASTRTADLRVEIALLHGIVLHAIDETLRSAIRDALVRQAPFRTGRIDIRVVDLIIPR